MILIILSLTSLWTDGELVHLEDLVLHDTGHRHSYPVGRLTIARDVLRRRIAAQLGAQPNGMRTLRQAGPAAYFRADSHVGSVAVVRSMPSWPPSVCCSPERTPS